jgi:hypothetical protein
MNKWVPFSLFVLLLIAIPWACNDAARQRFASSYVFPKNARFLKFYDNRGGLQSDGSAFCLVQCDSEKDIADYIQFLGKTFPLPLDRDSLQIHEEVVKDLKISKDLLPSLDTSSLRYSSPGGGFLAIIDPASKKVWIFVWDT